MLLPRVLDGILGSLIRENLLSILGANRQEDYRCPTKYLPGRRVNRMRSFLKGHPHSIAPTPGRDKLVPPVQTQFLNELFGD